MPAKRNFNVKDFLSVLKTGTGTFSTGEIARAIKCHRSTCLRYLRELKAKKQIVETRISNTLNVWRLTRSEDRILFGDCAETLKSIADESVDLIVTDPPYGYNFMGLSWDRALPSLESLKECLRVLKSGAIAFIMCSPRQDVLCEMIYRLKKAGFKTGFSSISWVYSTGFAKISDTSKLIDKKLGAEREVIGKSLAQPCHTNNQRKESQLGYRDGDILQERLERIKENGGLDITAPATEEAKKFSGAYNGFNVKPATEVILVVMKQLSEKSYTDQALKNGKGVSWLTDCKIPWASDDDMWKARDGVVMNTEGRTCYGSYNEYDRAPDNNGRFPANLLVSDDALNDGRITKSKQGVRIAGAGALGQNTGWNDHQNKPTAHYNPGDSGSFSRYFDLDAWFKARLPEAAQKTYPYLIVPKPSKNEKNKHGMNNHPTVKPLKLMSYLITMGSREGDLVLDPFAGSGTTLEAANMLKRRFIGCESDEKYRDIIEARAHARGYSR